MSSFASIVNPFPTDPIHILKWRTSALKQGKWQLHYEFKSGRSGRWFWPSCNKSCKYQTSAILSEDTEQWAGRSGPEYIPRLKTALVKKISMYHWICWGKQECVVIFLHMTGCTENIASFLRNKNSINKGNLWLCDWSFFPEKGKSLSRLFS